jgi:hypothetical protein
MKKLVIKYSKLSTELKKAVRQKLENEDVKFFNFPYQGNIEEGFLFETEGDEVNYLVILDTEKKTKYKPTDEDDENEDDDFDDVAAIEEDLKGVDADVDEFKVEDVDDDIDDDKDVDDFDDDEDVDDIADEEFDDDDEK